MTNCQKLSTKLVKENDTIIIESNWNNINILISKKKNDRFPLEKFTEKIKYKFNWHKPKAKSLIEIDPKKGHQKTCHECEYINDKATVNVRKWKCPKMPYIS